MKGNKIKCRGLLFLVIVFLLIVVSACTNGNNADNSNENDNVESPADESNLPENENNTLESEEEEPVTIQIAYSFGEDSFHDRFDHIDEKLPHIDIEYVPYENTLESLQELHSNNISPDIIIQYNDMTPVQELDVIEPIDELAEKHGFDINSLEPSHVAYIRSLDKDGKMIGLPDGSSHGALYYNKEIFDLFGEDYPDPSEHMTWEEVFELASRMTAERNEINYVGFEFAYGNTAGGALHPFNEFALNMTDSETGEFLFHERPEFQKYFELMDYFYNIPGVYDADLEGGCLFCSSHAAMTVANNLFLSGYIENLENIDMAPMPVWEEAPTTVPYYGTSPMIITNYSEHKDEAFQVLQEYVSPENQVDMVKTGSSASVLSDR